jgi:predicted  nucleic acid-binding Zn-ribbon protein
MPVRTIKPFALSLILASGAALSACDRSDPAARPLAVSSAKLQGLSGGSYNAPSAYDQNRYYKDVLTTAKPVMDADNKSAQGAAAAGMVGNAQLGQAQPQLLAASNAEISALGKASLIRTLVDNYTSQSLSAETAGGFDPAAMIADLDKSRAEAEKEIAQNQAKLADIERKIADLSAKAESKAAEAKKLSDEFLAVRASLANLSAREAEAKLTAARETKRQGDAIRVDASRLQAQADMLKPEAAELKVLVDASKNRIAGLDRMKLEASEKAQQGQAAAAQARAGAADAAKQIEEKLKDLASVRSNDIITAYDAGIASLRTAANTARTSASDAGGGGAGKLLVGRAQLALADALSSKAASLQTYAAVLTYVANAKPTLSFAPAVQNDLKSTLEMHKLTLDDAKSAFEAAESAFAGIQLKGSGTGEIKDRLTKLAERLGALAGKTPATEAPAETPAETPAAQPEQPAPTPEAAPAQSAAGDDAAAGWATIYNAMETGDATTVLAHTKLADPAHESIIRTVTEINAAGTALENACTEKFGKSLGATMGSGAAAQSAADYTVTTEGDSASVAHASMPAPLKLVREDGAWKLDSASVAGGPMAMMIPMADRMKAAFQSVTADVKDGKITKIEDVAAELQKRLMGGGG